MRAISLRNAGAGAVRHAVGSAAATSAPLKRGDARIILGFLENLLISYGYIVVTASVMIESMGVPMPGETLLLIAAAYAGAGHLSVAGVIAAAAVGAIVGDTIGYEIGRHGGRALLKRYGRFIWLKPKHLERAEEFFKRHGDKTVFLGRFIAILRTFSAFLAGVGRMRYWRFLLFNASGGIVWATAVGLLGAAVGSQWQSIADWIGRAGLILAGIGILIGAGVLAYRWAVRHGDMLLAAWERFIARPRIRSFRRRFAPQIAFARARLSPGRYLGLHLTVGVLLIIGGLWIFGVIVEAVARSEAFVDVDRAVVAFLATHREAYLTSAMLVLTTAGSPLVTLSAAAVLATYFVARRQMNQAVLASLVVGGAQILDVLVKVVVARPRPAPAEAVMHLATYSFPSAHAMDAIAFYGLLTYLVFRISRSWNRRVAVATAAFVLTLLIGFSRIYLGVQYPSDVLGGYAAGFAWLVVAITGFEVIAGSGTSATARRAAQGRVEHRQKASS